MGSAGREPIVQIVVNYWEIPPSKVSEKLELLTGRGIRSIASFVPWQIFEADISHALLKFLQAAADKKIAVTLIATPELGLHAPYSGIPKELLAKPENLARDSDGSEIPVALAPQLFALPSLSSPEFIGRVYSFLSRLNVFLRDLGKSQPRALANLKLEISGSFWKSYRSLLDSALDPLGGAQVDTARAAQVAYRKGVEEFYQQAEFATTSADEAARWRGRSLERSNTAWYFRQSEEVFRLRCEQILSRGGLAVDCRQVDVVTPEADPALSYSSILQRLSGGFADFSRLHRVFRGLASRTFSVAGRPCAPRVHWTDLGGFRTLTDPEKQFLILESLLVSGARGGRVLVDESEWFSLSQSFRARAEVIGRAFSESRFTSRAQALYLAPSSWSSAHPLGRSIQGQIADRVRWISSPADITSYRDATLVAVDPEFVMTRDALDKLIEWAKTGHVVALPRSAFYSEVARERLERLPAEFARSVQIQSGVAYTIYGRGEARIIVYETEEPSGARVQDIWSLFARALFGVAHIETPLEISDPRVRAILLPRESGRGRGTGVFLLNASPRAAVCELKFKTEVRISDLAPYLRDHEQGLEPEAQSSGESGERFSLEVPPYAVLPLAVDGLEHSLYEVGEAVQTSAELGVSLRTAAEAELPGFLKEGFGEPAEMSPEIRGEFEDPEHPMHARMQELKQEAGGSA